MAEFSELLELRIAQLSSFLEDAIIGYQQCESPLRTHTAQGVVLSVCEQLDHNAIDHHANEVDHFYPQANKTGKPASGQGFDHPLK
jgi:hypothetical protein